ncbi:MAG: hypothetical protein K2P86_15160 [Xanthobacteraceae bacterium]|nr:hypothetical protein [Xanthobacteraceae bacterium]
MRALLRAFCLGSLAAFFAATPSVAQNKVKTQTIREQKAPAEIIRDLSRLPEPVRKIREEILAAARTGDIAKVAALVKANQTVISFGGETEADDFWKKTFPDSGGVEVLSTLIEVLEMPFVHLDKGNAQEMFVWPYFHAMQLDKLTPEQRVELFRLVTAFDFREMQKFGSYNFFRAGISPDGKWQFFVAGD